GTLPITRRRAEESRGDGPRVGRTLQRRKEVGPGARRPRARRPATSEERADPAGVRARVLPGEGLPARRHRADSARIDHPRPTDPERARPGTRLPGARGGSDGAVPSVPGSRSQSGRRRPVSPGAFGGRRGWPAPSPDRALALTIQFARPLRAPALP